LNRSRHSSLRYELYLIKSRKKATATGAFFGITTFFIFLIFSPNITTSFAQRYSVDLSAASQGVESLSKISRQSDSPTIYSVTSNMLEENSSLQTEVTQQLPQQNLNQTSETGSNSFSDVSRGLSQDGEDGDLPALPLLP
jgi:hypothetical protein